MYITAKELAKYIQMPLNQVECLIAKRKIKAHFDGEQYMVNQSQFDTYFQQLKIYRAMIEEYWRTPIPEDIDVKDED